MKKIPITSIYSNRKVFTAKFETGRLVKFWSIGAFERSMMNMMKMFEQNFQYKLIYIFTIFDDNHRGLLKIGDTYIKNEVNIEN